MNLDFEVVIFYLPYACEQAKQQKLVRQQMIKIYEQLTNNAEQFCGQRKERIFKCEHFTNFCAGW